MQLAQLATLQRAAALLCRRIILALEDAGRQPERDDREADHHEGNDIAQRIVDADGSDPQVSLGRQHVGHAEYQRRAEVVEYLHEDQCRACYETGHRQREDHAAEQAESFCTQVQRTLLHRAVNVAQRDDEVHQDEGKVMDALDEHDARQAVHDRQLPSEPVVEQQVHASVQAEDELQRHRADEGRHHQRQHAEGLDQDGATELEAHREVGERNCDQRREEYRQQRYTDTVPERFAQQRLFKEGGEVAEGKMAIAPEGSDDHSTDRQQQEHCKQGGDGKRRQGGRKRKSGCHDSSFPPPAQQERVSQ